LEEASEDPYLEKQKIEEGNELEGADEEDLEIQGKDKGQHQKEDWQEWNEEYEDSKEDDPTPSPSTNHNKTHKEFKEAT